MSGLLGTNYCANLCTNNGRYCATHLDDDMEKSISGADVVRESLRRICIWRIHGIDNGIGEEWWDYIAAFKEHCAKPEYFSDTACIKDAYKASKIEGRIFDLCMLDSGGLRTVSDTMNSKLASKITAQTQRGVVNIPTASVNSAAIRSALNVKNMFPTPTVCMTCAGCPDTVYCVS
jgi:hypothetical protein